jgi:glycosyltransferase involved in cell wall biosynthesis
MISYLRHLRVYLYTGTRPASYTLGLIEAMLSGVPIVSIGAHAWGDEWGGADLFEGHELANIAEDDPTEARRKLRILLADPVSAERLSRIIRDRAVSLFGITQVSAAWRAFLS